jgi:similar to stage IV sporulation protein
VGKLEITGFTGLDETEIRQTLRDGGLYEGARIKDDFSKARQLLYENYDRITWVSFYREGRLIRVNLGLTDSDILTADDENEDKTAGDAPVNVVASRSGYIKEIQPLVGYAQVEEGDYVSEGDVVISGEFQYQSTDYSKGDKTFVKYSHASGKVTATVPEVVTYYFEKNQIITRETGRGVYGFKVKLGDLEFDTTEFLRKFTSYEYSERNETELVRGSSNFIGGISWVTIKEVTVEKAEQDEGRLRDVVDAALRQYEKEELGEGEEIESRSVEFAAEGDTIVATVFMEVLREIGREEAIQTS